MNSMFRQNPERVARTRKPLKLFLIDIQKSGISVFKGSGLYPSNEAARNHMFGIYGAHGAAITVREARP